MLRWQTLTKENSFFVSHNHPLFPPLQPTLTAPFPPPLLARHSHAHTMQALARATALTRPATTRRSVAKTLAPRRGFVPSLPVPG